ncbi:Large exoprotein involved in heme utilizationor adhesion [Bibersteinia trehalosi USDA-ARS-USMARC-190]|uniref:Large exoprotein involved in heme utilizationor adhesion n=1 Tax=Bibersteinia trehalosi USDA-ARS-USMARC-190 TaxID=1263832 RepID=W0R833_BIBTR|nr:hemagglutinin repeat-containing protein [Bibersteinia trehalosi]AHG86465.1 Large exoprotein involved in heme utilizationor adhesion [Bibersteinia trehalosi USDA-ARS-USMARC-190]
MNKQCFRVIFSKTLQRLVVVSELAKSEGKSSEPSSFSVLPLFAKIRPLTFSLFCALGFVTFSDAALGETLIIRADKSAPKNQQPIILSTANGIPQVNIQTPNDKGLSHNKYSQFDVAEKGAILNNSRTNTQTQLAGQVAGNPYLARGEAKVILNEVNSSKPSVMKGYVEVAGKKAEVIIANPSGLHCEGCGIINSDRTTLTTGKPQIKHGHLDSFVVEKGKVKVSGKGLDNSRVDYTEIISRHVEANAGIWSKKETNVITGKNTVKRSDSDKNLQIIHTKQALAGESKPQVAIDVGELGGMYSGKIHLIGTEQGVGVRNAGHIGASAETLTIDSQGRIVNSGTLNAQKQVQLNAQHGIENQGKIENKQGDIQLNSKADIQHSGSIVARGGNIQQQAKSDIKQRGETVAKGNITYTAQQIHADKNSLIAAGVEVTDSAQGEVRKLETQSAAGKTIQLTATEKATVQGKNLATSKIEIKAKQANLDNSHTAAQRIAVTATEGNIQANQAILIADKDLKLSTPTLLETQGSHLKAENIATKQRSLNTQHAVWEQTGRDELNIAVVDKLHNQGGTFKTQGDLSINAKGMDNRQGRLLAKGKLTVDAQKGQVDSSEGVMLSNQHLQLTSGELINDGGLIQFQQNVTINTQGAALSNKNTFSESNDKGIVALGELNIETGNVDNQQGRIASAGKQTLAAVDINNQQGLVYAQADLHLEAKNLSNDKGKVSALKHAEMVLSGNLSQQGGQIEAEKISLSAQNMRNTDNSRIIANHITVTIADQVANLDSLIQAERDNLTISSQALDNRKGEISSLQNGVMINTHQQKLDNQAGKIHAKSAILISSGELDNREGAIHSASDIVLNAKDQKLINDNTLATDKGIVALGNITLNSADLDNQQGYIASQANLTLNVAETNNTAGLIKSNRDIHLDAQSLRNDEGMISGVLQLALNITDGLQQQAGNIVAGELSINAGSLNSTQDSVISANNVAVAVKHHLTNTQSEISATQHLNITSQAVENQQGLLFAEMGNLSVNTQQHRVNNQQGKIVAGQAVSLASGALENQRGLIQGKTGVKLNTHGQNLDNTLATIISQQALSIRAGELNNQQGYIQATAQADIQLGRSALSNQEGVISAGTDLRLNAGHVKNHRGAIVASHHLNASMTSLTQQNGTVKAGELLNIQANGDITSNQQSQLSAQNIHITTTGRINNQDAEIVASDSVVIDGGEVTNTNGVIVAQSGSLEMDTHQQGLINQQGKLSAGADLAINSGKLDNQAGLIQSRQNMQINTHQGDLDNQHTKATAENEGQAKGIIALGTLALNTQHLLNNNGYVLSNEAQTVNAQSLQNNAAVLSSLTSQKVTVRQAIHNEQGRISAGSTALNAQSLDNQSGLLQGDSFLHLQVDESLNNQKGQIKANENVAISAQSVNNQAGVLSAIRGNLSVVSATHLNNAQGNITAQKAVSINAAELDNTQGVIYNEQDLLTLNLTQHTLENQQGKVIAKESLTLESGAINNQQGVIYAEKYANLHVTGKIDNQQNGKIYGLGEIALQADTVDNRGGEIRTQDKLTLNVTADINNQKFGENGSFIESGNVLTINTATLNNRHTKSSSENMTQGILATVLSVSANVLDNQQGKLHSRTQSNITLQQHLDNRQGEVTGRQNVSIHGAALDINNQDGHLQAGNSLSIFANAVSTNGHIEGADIDITQQKDFLTSNHINANNTLSISTSGNLTNSHHLYADERVTLNANHITNNVAGRISSANTTVAAKGNVSNEGLINGISPDDNAKTVVKAGGKLLNTGKGRIYGDDIALQADQLENRDKDYGNGEIKSAVIAARGNLDIAAREIDNNTEHYLADNQVGATLFSVGNMTFGRVLNANNQAEGKAEILRNNSSVIESERNIQFNAKQVENHNIHLQVHHVVSGQDNDDITLIHGSQKTLNEEYIVPNQGQGLPHIFTNHKEDQKGSLNIDSDTYIPMEKLTWAGWSRAGQLVYNLKDMEPALLKAGDTITEDMLLASRNQMSCDTYTGNNKQCHYIPAGQYDIDSPIWQYANVTAPTTPPVFSFEELETKPWYKEQEWFALDPKTNERDLFIVPNEPVEPTKPERLATESDAAFQTRTKNYQQELVEYRQAKEKWDFYQTKIKPYNDWMKENEIAIEQVDKKIESHNQALRQKLGQAYFRNFWVIKLNNSREDESKVKQSLPGQILAGGDLNFAGSSFLNNRSHTIAGGELKLIGNVTNEDQEGLHRLTESGTSQYTNDRWRGGFKKYFQRDWNAIQDYKRIIETPFDMDVVKVEEHADYHTHKRTAAELKSETVHTLSLTSIEAGSSTTLTAAGLQTLDGLVGGDIAAFTLLNGTSREVSGIEAWQGNKPAISEQPHLQGMTEADVSPLQGEARPRQLERVVLADEVEVRSIQPNLVVPQNVLYRINPEPSSKVLIETDPDFTNQKRWLSSDYMFNALRYEPNLVQKRLGDGFYEQRLVREQINRLTGRQFLGNYTDFDSQYKALMNAGVTFAEKFNLRLGVALSPSLVAQLTTDIVWFESESVTLPNGKQEQVLVPKVYAFAQKGDITGKGTLLSGNKVIHRSGELINNGTVSGRELVQFDSDSIRNSGTINGGVILGNVSGDMENIGGTIEADRAMLLNISNNFTHSSSTHESEVKVNGYQRTESTIARKGLLHVKGEEGVLRINANNIAVSGANILNDGQGQTYLSAKNNLNLSTVSVGFAEQMGGGNHYRNESSQTAVVSRVSGNGDVTLSAKNIYSEGADLDAKGKLIAKAENDIVLGSASNRSSLEEYHKIKSGSAVAKKTQSRYDQVNETLHKGTELTGNKIEVKAGNDIQGESLLAVSRTDDIDFIAGNNVTLNSATNLLSERHIRETKRSGFLNGGELGFTIGSQKIRQENTLDGAIQSTARNTLGSEGGNIRIQAGNKASVSNVDVLISNEKTAVISGKNGVRVEAGKDVINSTDNYEFSQSGLSLALSTPVTDAIQSAQQSVQKAKATQNEKLKGVYAMKAAEDAVIAAQNAQKVAETLGNLGDRLTENNAAAENPAVKISVSLGTQKQERESHSQSVTHSKSNLNGGNIALISEEGKVELEGVDTRVKDTLLLDGKLGIESKGVADTYQNNTKNKNHSASVGVFVGFNGDSYGIGLEASASVGKGKENSESETWQNNQLQAGNLVTNSANGKLLLDATNVKANRWEGEVQDFEAKSRQDITKYSSEQVQAGGSVSVTYGSGGGATANAAYNSAKLNTAQVENQTAIDIGKGGMDVKVKNNAHFDGAVMTSQAEKENNRFQAGTLTTGDIENHSELKTRSAAISGGSGGVNPMSALSLLGNKNESERSTTRAAIGENIAINLTQDPNAETTLNNLNRDTQNANQKVTKHDIHQVQETQELIKGIGEISDKAFQIYTHSEREVLEKAKLELGKVETRLRNEGKTKEEIAQNPEYLALKQDLNDKQQTFDNAYGTGSKTKRAVDAVTAALQGLAAKDAGQAAVGLASPYLNAEIKKYTEGDTQANLIAHALLGAVEAAATGNNVLAGAAAGAGSEAAADFIVKTLYKGKSTQDLTEAEKQNVTLLSQLASGLASGLIGDSTQSAAVGADVGKRAVENNLLLVDYSSLKGLAKSENDQHRKTIQLLKDNGIENIDDYAQLYANCLSEQCQKNSLDELNKSFNRAYDKIDELAKSGQLTSDDINAIDEYVTRVRSAYDSKRFSDKNSGDVYFSGLINVLGKNEDRLNQARLYATISGWAQQGYNSNEIENKLSTENLAVILSSASVSLSKQGTSSAKTPVVTKQQIREIVKGTISISRAKYPETVSHIEDSINQGKPSILTIDRKGAAQRRKDALQDIPPKTGYDRDEYPPAMFKEGGEGSSVRYISPKDNRGAGSCIGHQCKQYVDGDKVKIEIKD